MSEFRRLAGYGLIGAACRFLQPSQPDSLIATALLCLAVSFLRNIDD